MIEPGSPEWLRTISPSKAAAILGVSRWESPYRLWHRMAGLVALEPPRDEFTAGHAMERALAYLWRVENPGWQLSPDEVQLTTELLPFPCLTTLDRRARRGKARRVVEFKIAADLYTWGDPKLDGEAPADYVAQVMAQMHFTGYTTHPGHLMVMGPSFRWRTYTIGYERDIGEYIEAECAKFWKSLHDGTKPDLDDSTPTYECVRELHPDIEDVELPFDDDMLAVEWLETEAALKYLERRARGLKTRVLDYMGNARTASVDTIRIADRQRNGHGSVSLYPNPKALDKLKETPHS